jgi:hypothetical protein
VFWRIKRAYVHRDMTNVNKWQKIKVLNTLARSFASIIEMFTSYSHTSWMTVATTDHICNCSTSNSNSEHPRRATRFTRMSEIQLTHTHAHTHTTLTTQHITHA